MSEDGGATDDAASSRGGDGVDQRDGAEAGGRPCPICEEPLYSRHCKYVCPQHGVIMDCSDTFY